MSQATANRTRPASGDVAPALLLLLFCCCLFMLRLGSRPLWDIDEGMHAMTSLEMLASGDWINPTFNGEPFYDKPAFFNWCVALAFKLFGATAFAARLPAALFGTATVLVVYYLGARMFDRRTGALAGFVLATSSLQLILSRSVVHDISLSLFTTTALGAFYFGYTGLADRTRSLVLMYAAIGLGCLAKGPLAVVLTGFPVLVFLIVRRRLGYLIEMRLGWGALLAALIAVPWFAAASLRDPEFASNFFIRKNLGSFSGGQADHSQPFYFYGPSLLGSLFPWSLALPLMVLCWPRRSGPQEPRDPPEGGDARLFLLLWAGCGVLFFSTATAKLGTYMLPLLPAIAILMSARMVRFIEAGEDRRAAIKLAVAWFAVISLAVGLAAGMLDFAELEADKGFDAASLKLLMGVVIGLAALGSIALMRGHRSAFVGSIALIPTVCLFLFLIKLEPGISRFRSTWELTRVLERNLGTDAELVLFRKMKETVPFYSGSPVRLLKKTDELSRFLEVPEQVYFIADTKRLNLLRDKGFDCVLIQRTGNNQILSNRAAPADWIDEPTGPGR